MKILTQQEFKRKWENYWYYYKWHTIAGLFVLLLVVIFIRDMVGREKYDANILLATSRFVSDEQVAEFEQQAEKYFTDIDGDGQVNLSVIPIQIQKGENGQPADPQYAYSMQVKLMAEVSSDRAMIYVFDQDFYDLFTQEATPRNLTADFPGNPQVQGPVWMIGESEFAKQGFLKDYTPTTGVKIYATMGDSSQITKPEEQEQYSKVFEGFSNMVNNKAVNP